MFSFTWLSSLAICGGLIAYYTIYIAIWRLYFSPLARFPGPKLAALTLWYEFYYDIVKHGQYFNEVNRLHSVYGPIIRINPFEIHVKDPDWYDELYTTSSRPRDKSAWYVGRAGGDSIFGTIPYEHHRLRRSALNPFFSKRSIAAIEPLIQDKVNKLCNGVKKHVESGQPVELHTAYMALTLDVISHYAFGKSFGLLEKPGFSPEWKTALRGSIEAGNYFRHFPWLADILMMVPGSVAGADVLEQVIDVLQRTRDPEKMHKTVFEELRDSELPPQEKTIERFKDEGLILVGAGGETTAQTLSVLTFHLLDNPRVLKKLKAELIEAIPDPQISVPWQKLEQLPFLKAVVIEAHRVCAVITSRLIRIAPNEVLKYHEWEIPAGTPTSMNSHFIHLDPVLFPEPYKFDPDRWLRAAEREERLEKYIVPFSKGSRACIGLNLASAELYLALASMIRRFDFELFETTKADVEVAWDGFTAGFRPESKGLRVKVVRETK